MNKIETALVPFHGHSLLTIKDGDTVRAAMKPICEGVGLDWKGQYNRINRHPVLSTCVVNMTIQLPGEAQSREIVTLPLDYLNGWLFGIDASRVKPEIRERLIDYQRECFAALAAYWQQGFAANPRSRVLTPTQQFAAHGVRLRALDRLETEQHPVKRRAIHAQLDHASRLLGLETPAIDAIGHEALPDHENPLLEEFWEVFEALQQAGKPLNHARTEDLIALNLLQVQAAAKAAQLPLPNMSELRRLLRACRTPRFVAVKAVNSAHADGTVKCWVFSLN